jgi:hypothetical protein
MSLKLQADAFTLITTSPGPALGSEVSVYRRTSGPPCLSKTTAFMWLTTPRLNLIQLGAKNSYLFGAALTIALPVVSVRTRKLTKAQNQGAI